MSFREEQDEDEPGAVGGGRTRAPLFIVGCTRGEGPDPCGAGLCSDLVMFFCSGLGELQGILPWEGAAVPGVMRGLSLLSPHLVSGKLLGLDVSPGGQGGSSAAHPTLSPYPQLMSLPVTSAHRGPGECGSAEGQIPQRAQARLDLWDGGDKADGVRIDQAECQVLPLAHRGPMECCRPGTEQQERTWGGGHELRWVRRPQAPGLCQPQVAPGTRAGPSPL